MIRRLFVILFATAAILAVPVAAQAGIEPGPPTATIMDPDCGDSVEPVGFGVYLENGTDAPVVFDETLNGRPAGSPFPVTLQPYTGAGLPNTSFLGFSIGASVLVSVTADGSQIASRTLLVPDCSQGPPMVVSAATATNVTDTGFEVTLSVTSDPVGMTGFGTMRSLRVVLGAVTCNSLEFWSSPTSNYSQQVAVVCTGIPVPGVYTAEVFYGTSSAGMVATTFALTIPAGIAPGAFVSLSPSRILDTRTTGGKLGAGVSRSLQVTGVGGVPASGVSAVVLNVTVTETTAGGYLTVSPTGSPRAVVSNLNWAAGVTIPNAVTVKVGTGGKVDLFQSGPGSAQVIVDVAGYFMDGAVTDAGGFSSLTPARILDTRNTGGAVKAGESRDLQVTGAGGVPASNVSAVVLNVTVTETSAGGYLSVFPAGAAKPLVSNLNWAAGATIPNQVVVKVGDAGKVSLFQSGPGSAQVIVDVAGYFLGGTPSLPGMFVALSPARVLDTRNSGAVAAGGDLKLGILGKGGLPGSGVAAVVVNTTVTETHAGGFLTVYPGTSSLPTASNLNWSAGATIPNLVTVQVGTDGSIKFHNGSAGSTQVIADTAGYYIGS